MMMNHFEKKNSTLIWTRIVGNQLKKALQGLLWGGPNYNWIRNASRYFGLDKMARSTMTGIDIRQMMHLVPIL